MAAQEPAPDPELQEQYELSEAMREAGSSPVDIIRALEAHLGKYPATKDRAQIEQALVKAALDADDDARIVVYGEKVLQQSNLKDDMTLIDRLTRALLDSSDPAQIHKALEYAKRYEGDLSAMRGAKSPGAFDAGAVVGRAGSSHGACVGAGGKGHWKPERP